MGLNDGNNDGRRTIESKDQWLENMKSQHNTKQKDVDALKPKAIKMSDLEYTEMPEKIAYIGEPGKASARTNKKSENSLGGLPKNMGNSL